MKPDWKDAPEWAVWLSMDADGEWTWWADMPREYGDYWYSNSGKYAPAGQLPDWEKSLEQRP